MTRNRLFAWLGLAVLIVAPAVWSLGNLQATRTVERQNSEFTATLGAMTARLSTLRDGAGEQSPARTAAYFLPGETPAIAGAALHRAVADIVQAAGTSLTEFEFVPPDDAPDDSGRLSLRVAFDTDIVGLQKIAYAIEQDVPAMLLGAVRVQSIEKAEDDPYGATRLRVALLVEGYWSDRR